MSNSSISFQALGLIGLSNQSLRTFVAYKFLSRLPLLVKKSLQYNRSSIFNFLWLLPNIGWLAKLVNLVILSMNVVCAKNKHQSITVLKSSTKSIGKEYGI